jgi:hypothetical protein
MFRNRNGLLVPEFDSALPTSPSLAPHGPEQDTYLVLEDLVSSDERGARLTKTPLTLIRDLVEGASNIDIRRSF